MGKKSGSGSGMNNPDHISESLKNNFLGLKHLNSLMRIRDGKNTDPGYVMEKFGSEINIPDPDILSFLLKKIFDINCLFLVSRSCEICRRHLGGGDGETLLCVAHCDRRAEPCGGGPAHCLPPPERPSCAAVSNGTNHVVASHSTACGSTALPYGSAPMFRNKLVAVFAADDPLAGQQLRWRYCFFNFCVTFVKG